MDDSINKYLGIRSDVTKKQEKEPLKVEETLSRVRNLVRKEIEVKESHKAVLDWPLGYKANHMRCKCRNKWHSWHWKSSKGSRIQFDNFKGFAVEIRIRMRMYKPSSSKVKREKIATLNILGSLAHTRE